MPSLAYSTASRVKWLAKEKYHYRRWKAAKGAAQRSHEFALYHDAHIHRVARDAEIKKLTPKPAYFTHVSEAAVELIKDFEGGRSGDGLFHPYRDAVGVWTIGYGHIEGVSASSKPLTQKQADALLRADLDKKYAPPVARSGKWSQGEGDALTSFVYNLGTGAVSGSPGFETLQRALRSGNKRQIANAILLYDKAGGRALPGLTRRRREESALFLKG